MQIKNVLKLGLSVFLASSICFASELSDSLEGVIQKSSIKKGAVSVSIKGVENFEHNSNMPVPPASLQKLITILPAINKLGEGYNFETKLYKGVNGDYLIVLGADPYLQSADLKTLIRKMPAEINTINIDDSVLDKNEWGEGWQWDDETSPYMPKFSSYNIDRNILKLYVQPTEKGSCATINFEKAYPINVVNRVETGATNSFTVKQEDAEGVGFLVAEGTVAKCATVFIPVKSPKKYFKLRLTDAILDASKCHSGVYGNKKLTSGYTLIDKVSHPVSVAKIDVLKNSDNFVSETLFKLSGGGSFEGGKSNLDEYYKKLGLDTSQISIVDASGVSKNNLIMTDFMTSFLELKRAELEPILATSGEGTLSNRLLYLKGNLRAKTGTLSNVSGLAGYLSTQNGHKYAFTIIINDPKSTNKEKKLLEDSIIKTLYIKG